MSRSRRRWYTRVGFSGLLLVGASFTLIAALASYIAPVSTGLTRPERCLNINVLPGSLELEYINFNVAQSGSPRRWSRLGLAFEIIYGVGFRPERTPQIYCDLGGAEQRWVQQIIDRNKRQKPGPIHLIRRARVSLWSIFAFCTLLLALTLTAERTRRRLRRRRGRCFKCSYDLTGNVSGVRPECGTDVKQP